MKSLFKIIPGILLCLLTLNACQRDSKPVAPQETIPADITALIKGEGFNTDQLRKVKGGYVVEGDIFLADSTLLQKKDSRKLLIAKAEQYRTTNLITGLPRVITLSVTNLPAGYTTATDIAIARYNAQQLRITFQRVASGGQVDIRYASLGAGVLGQSAGFPNGSGNPPSPILLNSDANALGGSPDQNYLATVIAHEIGHTIGFRHTDYFNRAYSCGAGGNEGDAGVGAINIPGTPTAADPNSWMLACIGNSVNRPFNQNDGVALNYLYGNNNPNGSGSVTGVTVLQDGTILGIGLDKLLYTRTTLTSPWIQVPNSGAVIGVTVLPNGTILGIGTDKQLYTRATLNSTWIQVPNSGAVTGITVLPDGTILGIGTDKQLYTRATLTSSWIQVPNSGAVIGITVFQNGTILGIGTDKLLYTRATLTSNWVQVPNSGAVIGVTILPNGTILGIGTDNWLYTRATLTSPWVQITQ